MGKINDCWADGRGKWCWRVSQQQHTVQKCSTKPNKTKLSENSVKATQSKQSTVEWLQSSKQTKKMQTENKHSKKATRRKAEKGGKGPMGNGWPVKG